MPVSQLLIGTKRGLFTATSNESRDAWSLGDIQLKGQEVFHAIRDGRTDRIFAASNHEVYGPEVVHSDDGGESWTESKREPRFTNLSDGEEGPTLRHAWHVAPGRDFEPGVIYLGGEPASLFRSSDNGETWDEVLSVRNHPTSPGWQAGAGGLCAHTILLDPERPGRMYIGISAAGFFRSDDAGESWIPLNEGVEELLPPHENGYVASCIHKAAFDPANSEIIYQQNHIGAYSSHNAGETWESMNQQLPSNFGFAMTIDPNHTGTWFTVPMIGGEFRSVPDGNFKVWKTNDGGVSWSGATEGLPQESAYLGVLREGMTNDGADPVGIYVGTNTGQVFYSIDGGDSWRQMFDFLPPILSLEASQV